jgi:hypothetical protein
MIHIFKPTNIQSVCSLNFVQQFLTADASRLVHVVFNSYIQYNKNLFSVPYHSYHRLLSQVFPVFTNRSVMLAQTRLKGFKNMSA